MKQHTPEKSQLNKKHNEHKHTRCGARRQNELVLLYRTRFNANLFQWFLLSHIASSKAKTMLLCVSGGLCLLLCLFSLSTSLAHIRHNITIRYTYYVPIQYTHIDSAPLHKHIYTVCTTFNQLFFPYERNVRDRFVCCCFVAPSLTIHSKAVYLVWCYLASLHYCAYSGHRCRRRRGLCCGRARARCWSIELHSFFLFALFIHNFGFFQLCTLPFSYLPSHTGFVSNLVVLFVIRSFATSIGHVPMVFLLHHPPQSIFLCRFAVFLHYFSLVFLARSRLGLKCERLFFSLCVYTVLNQNK